MSEGISEKTFEKKTEQISPVNSQRSQMMLNRMEKLEAINTHFTRG